MSHARAQLAADKRALADLREISEGRTGTITVGVGEAFTGDATAAPAQSAIEQIPDLWAWWTANRNVFHLDATL